MFGKRHQNLLFSISSASVIFASTIVILLFAYGHTEGSGVVFQTETGGPSKSPTELSQQREERWDFSGNGSTEAAKQDLTDDGVKDEIEDGTKTDRLSIEKLVARESSMLYSPYCPAAPADRLLISHPYFRVLVYLFFGPACTIILLMPPCFCLIPCPCCPSQRDWIIQWEEYEEKKRCREARRQEIEAEKAEEQR